MPPLANSLYTSVYCVRAVPIDHIEGSQAFPFSFFVYLFLSFTSFPRTAAYMPASTEGIMESFVKNRENMPEEARWEFSVLGTPFDEWRQIVNLPPFFHIFS